jgi:phospholipid-binding lipoprotein MlaA
MKKYSNFAICVIVLFIFICNSMAFAGDRQDSKPEPIFPDEFSSKLSSPMLIAQNSQTIVEDDDDLLDDFDNMKTLTVSDPLYYFNYAMYKFNDVLVMPIAKGYKFIMPELVRNGIDNFFHNLLFPVRFVNNLLQGEINDAGTEVGVFLINSTLGVAGFGQVAQDQFKLHTNDEDLGQTLGSYSIGNGFYIVWPFLGPSTLRDSIGLAGDYFLTPINHPNTDFFDYGKPWELHWGLKVVDGINSASLYVDEYKELKEAAIDPYVALRDAYIQNRAKKVKD